MLQFSGCIVREFYGDVAAGRDAGIHPHEFRHLLCVARHYTHELSLSVFQKVQKRIHGVHPETPITSGAAVEGVCLVNEKDAAHGLVNVVLYVGLRVSYILADEILAGDLHELAGRQRPDGAENLPEFSGEGGFSRAGIAGEKIMVLKEFFLHSTLLLDLDVPHNGADLILYALKADILVKFREDLFLRLWNEAFI